MAGMQCTWAITCRKEKMPDAWEIAGFYGLMTTFIPNLGDADKIAALGNRLAPLPGGQ
jgi:hypothetical protein